MLRILPFYNAQSGKILSPTQDVVFKLLFASSEPDSREALRALVSDCIHRPVRNLSVKNSEALPGYPGGKLFRLDIHAAFNNGEEADIEMQVNKTDDDLIARSLVCAGRLLGDQLKRGNKYLEVKRVYQIMFDEGIMLANKRLDKLSRQSDKWARALSRDKAVMDYKSGLYAARVKGKAEAKAEDARNMKAEGDSIEKIARITGLARKK
jgi:hypothetical protein